jgi:predicted metal-dependent phosphoesterase TrpH
MYIYETHLHTFPVSACGGASPQEMVRAYKSLGYAGFIITDHFLNGNTGCPPNLNWEEKINFFLSAYHDAQKEAALCDFDVFLGWEYAIHGTEFLTYGLDEAFMYANENFDKLPIEEYSALVRENGGYIAQAHPYRDAVWVKKPYPVAAYLLDGIEVHNASQPPEINQKAFEFAKANNLPMQSGSDAHNTTPHAPAGVKLPHRAKTVFDIIEAIKNGSAELVM